MGSVSSLPYHMFVPISPRAANYFSPGALGQGHFRRSRKDGGASSHAPEEALSKTFNTFSVSAEV